MTSHTSSDPRRRFRLVCSPAVKPITARRRGLRNALQIYHFQQYSRYNHIYSSAHTCHATYPHLGFSSLFYFAPASTQVYQQHSTPNSCIHLIPPSLNLASRLLLRCPTFRREGALPVHLWLHFPVTHLCHKCHDRFSPFWSNRPHLSCRWRNRFPVWYVFPIRRYT